MSECDYSGAPPHRNIHECRIYLLFRANQDIFNLLFRDFRVIIRSYYGYTIFKGSDGMLKRKIYDALTAWKNSSKGTTAMMIDGARRVGKSFIAEQFAKAEYKTSFCPLPVTLIVLSIMLHPPYSVCTYQIYIQ